MPLRLDARAADFEARFAAFLGSKREAAEDVDSVVAGIIEDVRERGDAAVVEYTKRFDTTDLRAEDMRVTAAEADRAMARCGRATLAALELAAERIRGFHERQRPADLDFTDNEGLRLGWRWTPIAAIGLYVPGGTAAYPSSVLMNALPAQVAGCDRLVMAVPAQRGELNPLVLAAARIAGVAEVYRIGGAQAIAALAYGTDTIQAVDKIVGPGNCYVAAAKRRVFGQVGIDMIAGPSEVLIVADGENDPAWIAADLLAQAEHDPAAQSILITDHPAFAAAVIHALERQLEALPRRGIAAASWRDHGCIILVGDLQDAPRLIDRLAPEHLQLALEDAAGFASRVRNAGSIFLGRFTPEALGDYIAGPNHVLPTSRSARFSSGLGVLDFMKRSTFLGCDAEGLAHLGPPAISLAEAEGLGAHARSMAIRLNLENRVPTDAIRRPDGAALGPAFRARKQGVDERAGVVEKPSSSVRSAQPPNAEEADRERIIKVILDEQNRIRLSPTVDQERKVALYDLIQDNKFKLKGPFQGPYILHLGNDGERLTFTVCDEIDLQLTRFSLPLAGLRRIIKEYFLICDRYFNAISTLSPSRIEAIDMGRRGLHNDGADRLCEWLADKVEMDKNTARRLFTLVCVLHIRR